MNCRGTRRGERPFNQDRRLTQAPLQPSQPTRLPLQQSCVADRSGLSRIYEFENDLFINSD